MKQKIIYKRGKSTYSWGIKVTKEESEMLKYLKDNKVNFSEMVKKLLLETYEEVSNNEDLLG